MTTENRKIGLALHGGAGTIAPDKITPELEQQIVGLGVPNFYPAFPAARGQQLAVGTPRKTIDDIAMEKLR